ncbi:FUSC family protein [Labrys monachus]|uniref:Integral membrane bound transporter domain-containing protein n=1 Tax=Labrys monachus TaxID=217067 RepID=A0ABU0FLB2_9HYPH|nr:FUSC family protein [Labrys monachus]MDQ0395389.1 hypothetical protein [Labrys monachus]
MANTTPRDVGEVRQEAGPTQSGKHPEGRVHHLASAGLLHAALDRLLPPDPGSLRLLAALRATLAGTLTFFLVVLIGTAVELPILDRVLGFAVALFIAATVPPLSTGEKLKTILFAGLGACATTFAASVLGGQSVAGKVALPVLMFAVTYFAVRGPRYVSIGMVSLVAYVFALVAGQPVETVPMRMLVLALAAADAALLRCVLMPERPAAEFERLQGAIRGRIDRMLALIGAAAAAGAWKPGGKAALGREVERLAEAILLAQARLNAIAGAAGVYGRSWLQLLEIGLGAERVARIAGEDLGTPAERAAIVSELAASYANNGDRPARSEGGPLGTAIAMLKHVQRKAPSAGPDKPAVAPPVPAIAGWKPALQTALATALAIMLSEIVLPNRWYWAAFAAFVMFQGTRSRGESIAKGMAFILGTTGGLVGGVLLATLLAGHELASLAVIIVAVFLAFQANVAAYGVMVFWITIILGLLFGMLGYFTFDVLLLRLEEAAVGVISGGLVASLVLVRRDRHVVDQATSAFAQALVDLVRGSAAVMLDEASSADLPSRILTVSQRFGELRTAAASRLSGFQLSRDGELQRRMVLLGGCESWARELADIALRGAPITDPALVGPARRAVEGIGAWLGRLTAGTPPPPQEADTGTEVVPALDDRAHHAVRLLLRIDAALAACSFPGAAPHPLPAQRAG